MPGAVESASVSLRKVANWDGQSQISQVLIAAFDADDYLECINNLPARGIKPQLYINSLDKIIDSLPSEPELRRRSLRALRKTCGLYGVLPISYIVPYKLGKPPQRPSAKGGFSDVWRITDEESEELVFAVKSLRVYEGDPIDKINKKYCKEVIICKRASHPNIMTIEGVAPTLFEFCMVSRWMPGGNLLEYMKKYPGADRLELLRGITRGLDYLHRNEVVHGDLKGPNILIDGGNSPRLTDFGLCSITQNIDSVNASTPNHGCTVRYCAPELLDAGGVVKVEKRKPTTKSDVYSLSMVIVELATGKVPFPDLTDPGVSNTVSRGKRPQEPRPMGAPGITPTIWKIAKKCWEHKAEKRPEVFTVRQLLEEITKNGDESERSSTHGWHKRLRNMFPE